MSRSKTPLWLGVSVVRAFSKLPKKSGLHMVMNMDNPDSNPSLSSSSSNLPNDDPKKHKMRQRSPSADTTTSSSTGSFISDSLFMDKPLSNYSSDNVGENCRKWQKRCHYYAKLNVLKYQQMFLKNIPPFQYAREIQVATFKKWCREIWDWIEVSHLSQWSK